jgi:hypothetical protein
MHDTKSIVTSIEQLIDGWCERRSLKPLRFILASYPLTSGLSDDWYSLLNSLKDIKGLCSSELTAEELSLVIELISATQDILNGDDR